MRMRWKMIWMQLKSNWQDYPLQPGKIKAGKYRIDAFLGMGSYGQAYACTDMLHGGRVLIKRNKPSKGELGLQLLRRESGIMKELAHPHIPKWLDYVAEGGEEMLVMELVDGYNLETAIHGRGLSLDVLEALRLLRSLFEPVAYLHARGFVHRDVRIPNVLLENGDLKAPKLIDYGLACGIGETLPEPLIRSLGETEEELAKLAGDAVIKRRLRKPALSSDWFGMGHLFLFMMYAGYEHPQEKPEASWEEELGLPEEVRAFVSKLLNDDGAWMSTEQGIRELDGILERLESGGL